MNIEIIPVTPFQQNCSLIWDNEKNAAIVDPGGEAEKLIQQIEKFGVNLKAILLTHAHLDHVGAVEQIKQHFNVEIWGSQESDRFLFDSLPEQAERFGLPNIKPFLPDRWLNEGEVVNIGDFRFDILHLPGHTPGHIGFIEQEKKVAFTGDVLFQGSVGRTDFPQGSHEQLISSIREKLFKLHNDMIIIAGHGPYTTIQREKATNPFLK
ncbi:MBL fold metallo-hydrolase [Rodentibacter caecimuris]|uniref:MBL fold metallo-hydrolase n=1 Tax=Rodentibacter caecimuris TaxID=1796644 RepID=A0AAJ3N040_9PAST|nr:MBL fold metallo-hydrolase [Rodentibacter heylii]AOF54139.1 putative metal-binding enzyme [Pasteurellaceae bacterium NI1060]OOF70095.1 MBL fold metallo-hydrolase [Rodentibacter heylii]OOF75092.1 MBL fold metallo-hydrolase [Rodentibacter heylii]OOF76021.1 MBL fold metallo-hydrolase [Rodentibacter heylii]